MFANEFSSTSNTNEQIGPLNYRKSGVSDGLNLADPPSTLPKLDDPKVFKIGHFPHGISRYTTFFQHQFPITSQFKNPYLHPVDPYEPLAFHVQMAILWYRLIWKMIVA